MAAVALVTIASACGGDGEAAKRRAAVADYVRSVNRVEYRFTPAFRRADDALRSFGTTRAPAVELRRLRAAATVIDSAGAKLRRITPPREATRVHRSLLRLYDREAALAREVAGMSAFLAHARELLKQTRPASGNGRLTADDLTRYSTRLRRTAAALAVVSAPPVLSSWRDDEVEWLHALSLEAKRLGTALRVNDAHAAGILAVRFRRIAAASPGVTAAQRRAVIGFNSRAKSVQDLRARVADELSNLDKSLR